MKSWKGRLLVVITMLAMLLAVSVPAMADHLDPRFIGNDEAIASLVDSDCTIVGDNDVKEIGGRLVAVVDPKWALCPVYDANGNVRDWKRIKL